MIKNDGAFTDSRRKFYENQYRISEEIDPWHHYAQEVVHSTTALWFQSFGSHLGGRILNAGSGGSDYGIAAPMTHLDLFESRIAHHPSRLVGDVARIPAEDGSFDVALCVGSVLNYADPLLSIRELSRVLRTGGVLILEYECSASFEYLRLNGCSRACSLVETFYGNVSTRLWVYGNQFVDGLLAASGLKRVAETRFHAVSSVALALTRSPRFATWFTVGDRHLAQLWPFRKIASNRMLAVEKLAHQ